MKNALYLVAFLAGAAVGAVAGITYVKKNYDISEKKEESEEDSAPVETNNEPEVDEDDREELIRRTNDDILKSVKDPERREKTKELLDKYVSVTSIYGGEEVTNHAEPYKILPDQFSEFEDYTAIERTLYADGVLADDRDEIVENADVLLGKGFRELFDEGSDELFIRNDDRCTDYAIYKDVQTFDAYDETRPHFNVED